MSKKTAEAVSRLLESYVRRYHINNYVAGTYCYGQRFFPGYRTILDVADRIRNREINREERFRPDSPITKEEKEALRTVWNELGKNREMQEKYNQGNRKPEFVRQYEKVRGKDKIFYAMSTYYPKGFGSIDDLVNYRKILGTMLQEDIGGTQFRQSKHMN